jgi:hypothetical protein
MYWGKTALNLINVSRNARPANRKISVSYAKRQRNLFRLPLFHVCAQPWNELV